MAGYSGYSMSNNAVDAYNNGEKPISKWTKKDILDSIEDNVLKEEMYINFDFNKLKKLPLSELKKVCLCCSSWHHTSCYYNRTNFYSLDVINIENLTDDTINNILEKVKNKKKEPEKEEKWECSYLIWSGSRRHPVSNRVTETGIIKGNWFYPESGIGKKKTTANGFQFIRKIKKVDYQKFKFGGN